MNRAPDRYDYEGAHHLSALLGFASRALSERFPLGATWHPGDIVWELREKYDSAHPIQMWEIDGTVQAVSWFVGPGQVWLEATPAGEAWIPQIIAWAEAELRRGPGMGQGRLSVRVLEGDLTRIEALTKLGFECASPESVQFELDLTAPLPEVELPEGFVIRDGLAIDVEQRAASHRVAWSVLDHIGIVNARSTFSVSTYESLRAAPVYRPELDLVVQTQDGTLVANCIGWPDLASGIGIFEPMGTHPDFRGRRLARALLVEGLRRLKQMGHHRARISTAHFNTSAIAAYSAVFKPLDRSVWMTKGLQPTSQDQAAQQIGIAG